MNPFAPMYCCPDPDPAWESDSMASSGSRGPREDMLAIRCGVSWGSCGASVAPGLNG